jgi:hypothetical protein
VLLALAAVVAAFWIQGVLAALGTGLLFVLVVALLEDHLRHRAAGGMESLNPYLLESPPGAEQHGDETERSEQTIGRFAAYARSEGIGEFEEAMTTERLRTQSRTERDRLQGVDAQ